MEKTNATLPETAPLVPSVLANIDPLMALARQGANVEGIRELVQLYREERAYQALREFDADFALLQQELGTIPHDARAKFMTKSGQPVEYGYTSLPRLAAILDKPLHAHGFSYSWDTAVEARSMTTTCTLHHRGGHKRSATFVCPISEGPLQSPAQATKGAQTFSHRCSLISVLGITTCDPDFDGADAGDLVTEEQARTLATLVLEVGAEKSKVLAVYGVNAFTELPACNFKGVVTMLERKRGAK